jgi:hypothetical protein
MHMLEMGHVGHNPRASVPSSPEFDQHRLSCVNYLLTWLMCCSLRRKRCVSSVVVVVHVRIALVVRIVVRLLSVCRVDGGLA